VRLAWRRRRVAVLALWRWIATLGALVPVVVTTAVAAAGAAGLPGAFGRAGPERLGADFAGRWATIPGHEIIAGPLDGLSKVASWPGALPLIGEWAMGVAIVAAAFVVLARVGVGQWETWDSRERAAARQRVPSQPSGWRAALTFGLLSVVAVAMSVATFAYLWR